ncbi:MAG: hypothetical protein ACREDS_00570 [Limisphaerales bacterium]
MFGILICLAILILVMRVLWVARRRQSVPDDDVESGDETPSLINEVEDGRSYWEKDPNYSPLARDRLEVLELWEKCSNDPRLPAPIPPTKPHPYFGVESGPDTID